MKKSWLFLTSGGLFAAFVGFSYLVHKNIFSQFDFDMTVKLQDHMPRRLDDLFSLFSDIGTFEVTGIALFILLIILFFKEHYIFSLIAAFSFGFFHSFEIYGKIFVKHLPPPHFMLRTHNLFNFPQFYVREENSYPSGHAARAIFVSTLLVFLISKTRWQRHTKIIGYGCIVVYDAIMLVSRVYLGEHWSSDVIGGSMLGASFALLSVALL